MYLVQCGNTGAACSDPTKPLCYTMSTTDLSDDKCGCEKNSGSQTAGDGTTQGTCSADKCLGDGTCGTAGTSENRNRNIQVV